MLFLNATLWPLFIRHIFVNVPNTDFVMTHFFQFPFLSQIDGLAARGHNATRRIEYWILRFA